MKKLLLTILFVISIPWILVAQQTVLLDEDFNSVATNSRPAGWSLSGDISSSFNWHSYYIASEAYDGNFLRVYNSSTGKLAVIKTPVMSFTEDMLLSFMLYDPCSDGFKVYISTDSGATYTTVLASYIMHNNAWEEKTIDLSAYTGQQKVCIVFEVTTSNGVSGNGHYSTCIDNVLIRDLPQCAYPMNISVNSLDTNKVTFSWNKYSVGSSTNDYRFTLRDENGNNVYNKQSFTVLYSDEYTITGLQPNSKYQLTLQADCSDAALGYSDQSEIFEFHTKARPIALPYLMTFENETSLPDKWLVGSNNLSDKVVISNSGYNSNKSLSITPKGSVVTITTPPFDVEADSMELDFYIQINKPITMQIGLTSDPTDPAQFNSLFEKSIPAGDWKSYRIGTALTGYAKQRGLQFYFMIESEDDAAIVNIDNVNVKYASTCQRLENLVVIPDSTSVLLSWDDYSFTPSNNYLVKVINNDTEEVDFFTGNANPLRVTGLSNLTTYSFYVQSICSASDSSEWSLPVSTTTICSPMYPVFVEDFEGKTSFDPCWVSKQTVLGFENGYGTDYGNNGWVVASYDNNKVAKFNYAKPGGHYILGMSPLAIANVGQYDLKFNLYRHATSSENDYIKVWATNNSNLDTTNAVLLGVIGRCVQLPPVELLAGWYEFEYNIPLSGSVYLFFEAVVGQNRAYSYLDDIRVELAPACRPAKKLVVASNSNSIDLSWTASETSHHAWIVEYVLYTSETDSTTNSVEVNNTNYSITGLNPATIYHLKANVYTKCDVNNISDPLVYDDYISTRCLTISTFPYVQDFETVNVFPPTCWDREIKSIPTLGTNNMENTWHILNNQDLSHSGNGAAMFDKVGNGANVSLISPKFNFATGKKYQVKFWMYRIKNNYYPAVYLQLKVTDNLSDNDGVLIGTYYALNNQIPVESKEGYYEYTVEIPDTLVGEQYLLFEGVNTGNNEVYFYIDDITVEEVPACKPIDRVCATVVDYQSIVVSTSEKSLTNWEVAVVEKGGSLSNVTPIAVNNVDSVTISGLSENTEYVVYARRVCEGNTYSEWNSNLCEVSTPCSAITITSENPFFENFESYEMGFALEGNTCYDIIRTSTYYDKAVVSDVVNSIYAPYSGKKCLSAYTTSFYYRSFYFEAGKTYEVSVYALSNNVNMTKYGERLSIILNNSPINNASNALKIIVPETPTPNKWTRFGNTFEVEESGIYYLGIYAYAYSFCGIDNWSVKEISCNTPKNIFTQNITNTSAEITFTPSASNTEVRVATIDNSDLDPAYDVLIDTISNGGGTINIIGLQQNKKYYYTLRSLCDDGSTSFWTPISTFNTQCGVKSLPYNESFEEGNTDFACWSTLTSTGICSLSTEQFHRSGNSSLKLQNVTLVTPEMDVTSLADYSITGYAYVNNEYGDTVSIGVMTNPSSIEDYEPIANINIPVGNSWVEFKINFSVLASDDYAGDPFANAKYIAIIVGDEAIYLDNIQILQTPTCNAPANVQVLNANPRDLKVQWTAGGNENAWEVNVYRIVENSNVGKQYVLESTTIVNTPSATLYNLAARSLYTISVTSICNGTDRSLVSYTPEFITDCAPLELPYLDDILSNTYNNLFPECWTQGENIPNVSDNYWRIMVSATEGVAWQYTSSAIVPQGRLISPMFDMTPVNGALINVEIKCNFINKVHIIASYDGGISYTDTIKTFIPNSDYYTISETVKDTRSAGRQVMYMVDVIGTQSQTSNIYSKAVLNKFSIEPIESCYIPVNVVVGAITSNSATIVISDSVQSHSSWDYALVPLGDRLDNAEIYTVNNSLFNITNLNSATSYEVYVRSNCGSAVSRWRKSTSFTTKCEVINTPYHESFESDLACYEIYYPENSIMKIYKQNAVNYVTDGKYSLKFNSVAVVSHVEDGFVILPQLDIPLNKALLNFKYSQTSYGGIFVVGIMNGNNRSSFIPLDTCENTLGVSTFNKYEYSFSSVQSAYNNYRIAICYTAGTSNYHQSYLDDMWITEIPETPGVEDIDVVSIGVNSAVFDITYITDTVEVSCVSRGANPNENSSSFHTTNRVTINGLINSTSYSLYARTRNSKGVSEWFGPFDFNTSCNAITLNSGDVWTEQFNDLIGTYAALPLCFEVIKYSEVNGINYPIVTNSTLGSRPGAMAMKGTNTIILPLFTAPLNSVKLSFKHIGNDCDIQVGTMQDQNVVTFQEVQTVSSSSIANTVIVDFSNYECNGNRIAIRTNSESSLAYIDDIVVSYNDDVFPPVIISSEVNNNSVEIKWNSCVSAVTNEYKLSTNGAIVASGSTASNEILINNLIQNTNYTFEVRSVDANQNATAWSSIDFVTSMGVLNAPFTITFEDENENSNWTLQSNNNNAFVFGTDEDGVRSGDKALYISGYPNGSQSYSYRLENSKAFAMRNIYLESGNYYFNYDCKVLGYGTYEYGRVFLFPADETLPVDNFSSALPANAISLDNNAVLKDMSDWASRHVSINVEKSGTYKLIVYWKSSGSFMYEPPIAIDNIYCQAVPCALLENIKVTSSHNTAVVTYDGYEAGVTVNYLLVSGNDTIDTGSVQSDNILLENLAPYTDYIIYLTASCAEGNSYVVSSDFNTKCSPITAPYSYGFEDVVGSDVYLTAVNPCWGELSESSYNKMESTLGQGTSFYNLQHHSGSNSVYFNSGINYYSDLIYNTFHMEANKTYTLSIYAYHVDAANVGNTISIVQIKNGKVEKTYATYLLNGNWNNISADITMSETGEYQLGFRVQHKVKSPDATVSNLLTVLDDMKFVESQNITPAPVEVVSVVGNEVTLSWSDVAPQYNVVLECNDVITLQTTVSQNSCVLSNLTPSSEYTAYVYGIIGNDTTNGASVSFNTDCGTVTMPYLQDFSSVIDGNIPNCWDNTSSSVLTSNSADNWSVTTSSGNKFMQVNTSNTEGLALIKTLPVLIESNRAAISFNYKNLAVYDRLYVCVADVDGLNQDTLDVLSKTEGWMQKYYTLEDYQNREVIFMFSTVASNLASGGVIAFDDIRVTELEMIPARTDAVCEGEPYLRNGFNLSAGDLTIGTSTISAIKKGTGRNIVDSIITVNLTVAPQYRVTLYDTICHGDVYNKGLFANVTPPITTAGRYQMPFQSIYGCDSIVVLYLNVLNLDSTINVNLCEGNSYIFNGNTYTDAGTYTIVERNNNGCDVTTTINITVIPKYYDAKVTKCDNEVYTWEGRTITTTGVYTANYTNVNGCDSIMRLYYTAIPTQVDTTITICRGSDYDFAGTTLTEPGTYNHSFVSTFGCDSVVNLTLVVTDPTRTVVNDYVCEGDDYNGNGFNLTGVTADTIAELTLQTYAGCDSIIELHLTLIPAVYDTIYASINPGETYEFANNTYTQAGEYEGRFYTSEYGCDSLVTLILSVGTSVESSYALPIVVAPNPVLGGQSTFVTREWTADEQNGMRVEVLNSVGQVVEIFTPSTFPIEVGGIYTSGVYYIRITSGTGDIYLGRLVVK
ncbi:MAG: fibronectin type III domain-containing protein [Candidatus Aphodosoma sp.]